MEKLDGLEFKGARVTCIADVSIFLVSPLAFVLDAVMAGCLKKRVSLVICPPSTTFARKL